MKKSTPPTIDPNINGPTRAVLYLRVSTKDQASRGGKAEGFSIPAQRQAAERKAESLGAEVIDEFVDRGESAKTAQRPELKRMLKFLSENSISYVIVHKVDRLARNRADDVQINLAIQEAGASLVSCTENIDDTPSGSLMHGIMSSIAEFYSKNLAAEVIKGSTQKAMGGGTVTRAPTGYLHKREWIDHQEIRTIELDPERAPLMAWAFVQYATGEWSIRRLLDAVTKKGLTSRPGPNSPSKPLSLSNFNRLLKNDYYIGIVTYRGVKYDGNHEPIVDVETFQEVQDWLVTHAKSGEKHRVHKHYLKGSLICDRCESRMIVSKTKNRHGSNYSYFVCIGRHQKRNDCRQKAASISVIEDKIIDEYRNRTLSSIERENLENFVHDELSIFLRATDEETERQQRRITRLLSERKKLLQAHYADAITIEQLKDEQARITAALTQARALLDRASATQEQIEANISIALDRIENCFEQYLVADSQQRREMNQSLFLPFKVADDIEEPITATFTDRFEILMRPEIRQAAAIRAQNMKATTEQLTKEIGSHFSKKQRTPSLAGKGSNNDWLVGAEGLEPPTFSL